MRIGSSGPMRWITQTGEGDNRSSLKDRRSCSRIRACRRDFSSLSSWISRSAAAIPSLIGWRWCCKRSHRSWVGLIRWYAIASAEVSRARVWSAAPRSNSAAEISAISRAYSWFFTGRFRAR